MTDTRNADKTFAAGNVMAYYSPFGTSILGNMSTPASPWICLGWIDTTGLTLKVDETMKAIPAAGTLEPIRMIVTAAPKTIAATFMEALNPAVLALYNDVPMASLQPAAETTIASFLMPEIPPLNDYAFLFDSFDGEAQLRSYAPQGKVTTRGNYQQQQADATTVAMTLTFYPQLISGTRSAMKQYVNFGGADLTPFFA